MILDSISHDMNFLLSYDSRLFDLGTGQYPAFFFLVSKSEVVPPLARLSAACSGINCGARETVI
jgi:hypothetical protein